MRLAHLRVGGALRLAAKNQAGGWVDLADATGNERFAALSGFLAAGGDTGLPAAVASASATADPQLGPAVNHLHRIICVGRNYRDHREEFGHAAESQWPEIFLRLDSSVVGPFDPVVKPSFSDRFDYEGELALVIGRGGRHIPAHAAAEAIFGYTVVNDVSVRDWQQRGQQWTPGKNFDGTLPVGPELVTADELDPADLRLRTRLNGETVQDASTAQLIFDIPALIEFISSWTTLRAGDLICTGTPGGVGAARDPQLFMAPGDVVEVEIEGIGALRNDIVAETDDSANERWATAARSA